MQERTTRRRLTAGVLAVLSASTLAQPPGERVLDGLEVTGDDGCVHVHVAFRFPVGYLSHYPLTEGSEVRVWLEPFPLSDDDQLAPAVREALTPPHDQTVIVRRAVYEGAIEDGPYLRVEFGEEMRFAVRAGRDARSIDVYAEDRHLPGACDKVR